MSQIGETEIKFWTCIAAEVDGETQPDMIGTKMEEHRAVFAFRSEAIAWFDNYFAKEWKHGGPTPLATNYHGPSDSPSNAWSVIAQRNVYPENT